MFEKVGFSDIEFWDDLGVFGLGIYEMGMVWMGKDLKIFVCNGNN